MITRPNPATMWDDRFSREEPVYGTSPNTYLQAQSARLKPGMNVLVPGDGYGRNGIWLAQQGLHVHTVDVSSVGVARARKAAATAGVEMQIENADLTTWNWPEAQYDMVSSIFLHLFPADRHAVHAKMLRALKPGGFVVLEAFTPGQLQFTSGGPKVVDLLYTAEILRDDFAGADFEELEEAIVDIDEGPMHRGRAAVVHGVFARK
jgi:cyclopropane fatty-acyl-phospholipid synthase-like methyltransferase